MQYMLLIYEDESQWGEGKTEPNVDAIVAEHGKLVQELGPIMRGGAGLKPTSSATTVRIIGDSKTIHDGPFAETKEQLGGFYLIDVPNLDEAIAIAKRVPSHGGSIETRPLLSADGGA